MQLEPNPENKTFLIDWIRSLVTAYEDNIDSSDMHMISEAIDGAFRLNKKDRVLTNMAPFLGITSKGSIAQRLSIWYGEGSYSTVFDNAADDLDFTKSRVFGFEMANLLRDKVALGPVLLYIFHRISISLDGAPTMIVLDEAWALIDNPVFAPKIKDWLKVLRKLNAMVIFATQSVEDATKSAISDTLIQQTATQIFLPNLKATEVYKSVFMLSQREYAIVKTTDPGSRYFLIRQGANSVMAKLDLSGMDDVISVLSGRAETVILLDEIRQESGDNPEDWLPIFIQRAKNV